MARGNALLSSSQPWPLSGQLHARSAFGLGLELSGPCRDPVRHNTVRGDVVGRGGDAADVRVELVGAPLVLAEGVLWLRRAAFDLETRRSRFVGGPPAALVARRWVPSFRTVQVPVLTWFRLLSAHSREREIARGRRARERARARDACVRARLVGWRRLAAAMPIAPAAWRCGVEPAWPHGEAKHLMRSTRAHRGIHHGKVGPEHRGRSPCGETPPASACGLRSRLQTGVTQRRRTNCESI